LEDIRLPVFMCVGRGRAKNSAPLFLKMSVKKHKRGDVREDGLVFWRYRKDKKGASFVVAEEWRTREKFNRYTQKQKDWVNNNLEKYLENRRKYFHENKEKRKVYEFLYRKKPETKKLRSQYHSEYMQNPENKKRKKEYCQKWYTENRERILKRLSECYQQKEFKRKRRAYEKLVILTSPQAAVAKRIRKRIRAALRSVNASKSRRTVELIGCSFKFLKEYIEKQFTADMSWDRPHSFHIDHIKPLSSFDLTDPKQQKIACHYTNLQPLSPLENIKKGAKIYPNILNV